MSKVYVIKNKEGKYVFTDGGYCYDFHKNIYDATFYGNKDDAMVELQYRYNTIGQTKKDFEDCEIVECTVAEGDLEKELSVYEKALKLAVLTQCNKSRQDLINQICKFNFTNEVYDFFLRQAQKELEGDKNE